MDFSSIIPKTVFAAVLALGKLGKLLKLAPLPIAPTNTT